MEPLIESGKQWFAQWRLASTAARWGFAVVAAALAAAAIAAATGLAVSNCRKATLWCRLLAAIC
jgi:hypothetical protein